MTASFISVSSASGTLGADPVVTAPAGASTNGRLMVAMGVAGSGGATFTPPAGWTAHPNSAGGQVPLWTKVTSSEPANYTFVVSGVGSSSVHIALFDGAVSVEAAAFTQTASGALVLTGVTSLGPDRLLFAMVNRIVSTSWTPPGSMTERYDANSTPANYTGAGGDEVVGSGATGTRSWTPASSGTAVGYLMVLSPSTQSVSPTGIASTSAVGTPTLNQTVSPTGVAATSAVGSPTVAQQQFVQPSGIASSSAVGTPTLNQTVTPSGIGSTSAVGSPVVIQYQSIQPSGVASGSAVGTPTVVPQQFVQPTGIASTSALGTPSIAQSVSPSGIPSGLAVGDPTLIQQQFVLPAGISPSSAVGAPSVVSTIAVSGIASTSVVGTPTVMEVHIIGPEGIGSTTVVGTPEVMRSLVVSGFVYNHETGLSVGAGIEVKLFDQDDVLVATTTTYPDGSYAFSIPPGSTDTFWTLATYEVSGVQYHGVSDRGCAAV